VAGPWKEITMQKNILVVDDEQDVRQYLVDILEDHGYTVRVAEDGQKAMDLIKEARPDLVLLDLLMPRETGTGLYRKMHGRKELRDIPVIIISGLAGRNVAVSKGVPVFDKPIEEQQLIEAVQRILGAGGAGETPPP
jgi:CheY-like chemotaxis protein